MYDVALFLHLLGVAVLIAGVSLEVSSLVRAAHATEVQSLRSGLGTAAVAGRLIPASFLVILLPAFYMVSRHGDDGGIRWSSAWVITALALFAFMAVYGGAVLGRRSEALAHAAAAAPDGPVTPELDRMRRDPALLDGSGFGVGAIFAFLFLMTEKPGAVGSVAAVVVGGVAGILLGRVVFYRVPDRAAHHVHVTIPSPAAAADESADSTSA